MIGIGIAVAVVLLAIVAVIATWASRYVKVGPDEVLILSGRKRMIAGHEVGYRIVRNGGTFVWPVLEKIGRLSLHAISTSVVTNNALTEEGVPLIVSGVAIFKIASDDQGIVRAAERYQGTNRQEIPERELAVEPSDHSKEHHAIEDEVEDGEGKKSGEEPDVIRVPKSVGETDERHLPENQEEDRCGDEWRKDRPPGNLVASALHRHSSALGRSWRRGWGHRR